MKARSAANAAFTATWVALAYLGGSALQLGRAAAPSPADLAWAAGLVALVALAVLAASLKSRVSHGVPARVGGGVSGLASPWRRALRCLSLVALGLSAGWLHTGWQARVQVDAVLPHALEGVDIVLSGTVLDMPQRLANGVRFRFEPLSAAVDGRAVTLPPVISLGWYAPWGSAVDAASVRSLPQATLRAGQRWRFTVRLRRPHGNLNPHGFDLELFLMEQGVRAVGHVRGGPPGAVLMEDRWRHPVERLRQAVRDAIFDHVDDHRAAGVLAALAVGDQSAIAREDWALFRATGIAHLVSISGLHVTMFAWLAGRLLAALWRRCGAAMWVWPAPIAGRWGGWAAAAAYALLAGWGVPAQRTVWMLGVVCALGSAGVRWPWPMVLLAAAVVVTALDPWALLQPGFWLSFAAVGLLMASGSPMVAERGALVDAPPIGRSRRWSAALGTLVADGVRAQVLATVGLAPLTLVFFQQLSLVGLLANLVAIPVVTLWVTPLALMGVAVPWLWTLAAWSVHALGVLLGLLAQWPLAMWPVPVAPLWAQAAGLLAALLAVAPLPWRVRWLALPLVLPLLWPPLERPAPGRFHLVAVDVGQGTAVLVRTQGHLLLFDTGPAFGGDSDAGQQLLVPLLHARGERRIDRLVLSHRDLDHVGGAASVMHALPVGELLSSLEADHPLLAQGVPHRPCRAGDRWVWDGVHFEVLHPTEADLGPKRKANARSCVLRVRAGAPGGGSVLLTGDIEREQEQRLVATWGSAGLQVDVLMAPHHGSKTSSSSAFLDATRPSVVVVQSGYRNRFGHPAPAVVMRYAQRDIRMVDSPRCGAWTWRGDAAVAEADCQRDSGLRHWHDRPPSPWSWSALPSPLLAPAPAPAPSGSSPVPSSPPGPPER